MSESLWISSKVSKTAINRRDATRRSCTESSEYFFWVRVHSFRSLRQRTSRALRRVFCSAISVLHERDFHHRPNGILDASQILPAAFLRTNMNLVEHFF